MAVQPQQRAEQRRERVILELLGRAGGGDCGLCVECITAALPHAEADVRASLDRLAGDGLVDVRDGRYRATSDGNRAVRTQGAVR